MGEFRDVRADRVMPSYDRFASSAMSCELPRWFYSAWSIAGLVALVKPQTAEQAAERGGPDVRPIALTEASVRAMLRQVIGDAEADMADARRAPCRRAVPRAIPSAGEKMPMPLASCSRSPPTSSPSYHRRTSNQISKLIAGLPPN